MDRFLMKILIGYPDEASEGEIVRLVRSEEVAAPKGGGDGTPEPVPQEAVFEARAEIHALHVAESIEKYMVDLVFATRYPERYSEDLRGWIEVGGSPRATLALDRCSRAHAWLEGRDHVTPDDVRAIVNDCLRHRIILSYEANAARKTTDEVVGELIKVVAVA